MSVASQAEPPNSLMLVQGEQITQAKGVCRLRDFVAQEDKGSEGGRGGGGGVNVL